MNCLYKRYGAGMDHQLVSEIGVDIFTEELLKEFVVGCLNLKSVLMTHTQVTGLVSVLIILSFCFLIE